MQCVVIVIRNADDVVVEWFECHHTKAMALAMDARTRHGHGYHVDIKLYPIPFPKT